MGKWKPSSEELKKKFHAAVTEMKQVERRKMFGYPCCFVNGNMFTGLHEENWVVRLPEKIREELQESHSAASFEPQPGRIMREYLKLPKAVVDDPNVLSEWLEWSRAYAASLPPKARKKRRS